MNTILKPDRDGLMPSLCRRNLLKALLLLLSISSVCNAKDKYESIVRIKVNVFREACDIQPGDDAITVDFGTVFGKHLYQNERSPGKAFSIHLINCDMTRAQEVNIKFLGKEDKELPGLLAFQPGSQASGAVVGIESLAGESISINKTIKKYSLNNGNTTLDFKAYVQGEPSAIKNHSIVFGRFSAISTFMLDYE
ncbi:fimbrial protein [Photorhabdus antumapuensis]|uniref:fimbrial protein n=1 Tax=Photorhabdus antumapuensis TaxID=2862867 RepID=UPI001CEDF70D|nr:fimbrial protein [Photorhabdus antumapuensis]MCA6220740.1 type 1 fimbrial protein [Photorhabdus antumapuensis]